MGSYDNYRQFMKSEWGDVGIKANSDLSDGVPQPDIEKVYDKKAIKIELPKIESSNISDKSFYDCTFDRCSRRKYSNDPLSINELWFLLWCTQWIKKIIPWYKKYIKDGSGKSVLRPVASWWAIASYETYLVILNVDTIEKGVYRYLPITHELLFIKEVDNIKQKLTDTFSNPGQEQIYPTKSWVVFFWACVPYRNEWMSRRSMHKIMLINAGHIAQNLYLAAEAINCGCCEIAGYFQKKADSLIGVDGIDEYTVLCSSIGHIALEQKDIYKNIPDTRIN